MPWLFSYGSNHPKQLAERLGHSVEGIGAWLPGYSRAFRGWSSRWEGGVATCVKDARGTVFGYACEVSAADLRVLDQYEGVAVGAYERVKVKVCLTTDEVVQATAYFSCSTEKNKPSTAYLDAVAKTVGSFWLGDDGKPVTRKAITIR